MKDAKTDPQGFFRDYLNRCDFELNAFNNIIQEGTNTAVSGHVESRTRKADITEALRFRIHDPLWMLSRQWQMGEFRGNDAGTAMSVRCQVASTPISWYGMGQNATTKVTGLNNETPLEPVVEQINREITPLVRVESATYFCSLLASRGIPKDRVDRIIQRLREKYPLKNVTAEKRSSLEDEDVRTFTASRNTRLLKFARAFSAKAFDGYALYVDLSANKLAGGNDIISDIMKEFKAARKDYLVWFNDRYLPKGGKNVSAWNVQELGYHFTADNSIAKYTSGDYVGGRVSWYSFDVASMKETNSVLAQKNYKRKDVERRTIDSLPVLASYPGAPNKRLWEFENRDVFMGNSKDMQAKGNVAFMQYATMYGNDWMMCPLKTEIGQYIEVERVDVYDTFGIKTEIVKRAGTDDKGVTSFGQRWQMFTNTPYNLNVYNGMQKEAQDRYANGLLFPPSLVRTLEGEPLEEVSLLRDEMANMVWGVETRIADGCGSSLDANLLASEVGQYLEDEYDRQVEEVRTALTVKKKEQTRRIVAGGKKLSETEEVTEVKSGYESDYKYSLMNTVPLNWIPFVPQHLKTKEERAKYDGFQGGRETILRRGKMPYFFKEYLPVRPLSSILQVEKVKKSDGTDGEKPFFINEEQVQGVGTVIRKNCQRSRWLDGRTFTWMGYSKQIKHTQGVSGLEFDNLLEPTR